MEGRVFEPGLRGQVVCEHAVMWEKIPRAGDQERKTGEQGVEGDLGQ